MFKRILFFKGIIWRPVASCFFILLIFYALLQLYAVNRLGIAGALVMANSAFHGSGLGAV